MDIDLFETTVVQAMKGENSVEQLRQKFQIDAEVVQALQNKIESMHENAADLQTVLDCISELNTKMETEADAKNKAVLNKIQTRLQTMATGMNERREYNKQVLENEKAEFKSWSEVVQNARKWLDREPYAEAFAQLYAIEQQVSLREENATVKFIETEANITSGYMSMGQHLQSSITEEDGGKIPHIGLEIDLHNGLPFQLMMEPSDRNDSRTELKISVDDRVASDLELDNPEKLKANKEKIRQIMEFCNRYGFSTFDLHIPTTFDGEVDENAFYNKNRPHLSEYEEDMQAQLKNIFQEVQNDMRAERAERWRKEAQTQDVNEEKARQAGEEIDRENISYDDAPTMFFSVSREPMPKENTGSETALGADMPSSPAPTPTPQQTPVSHPQTNPTRAEAEKLMEELLEGKGLNKTRGVTYFEKRLFRSNCTEYIVYDNQYDKDHDGERNDKTGEAKFTYSFKLFVSEGEDGRLTFSYRFNKGDKKALINAMVGKFADMGYTHINFPAGLPDDEKGLWRTALAEKGIVWVGMSLDIDKAEAMIKAAKDKHMSDEKLATYKYRLASQMEENKAKKGKTLGWDEAIYVENTKASYLGKSWLYSPFTNCYANHLYTKLENILGDIVEDANGRKQKVVDSERGAIKKVAAYNALFRMWNLYCAAIDAGGFEHVDYKKLGVSPEEKRAVLDLLPIALYPNYDAASGAKMAKIMDIFIPVEEQKAKTEIYSKLNENRELSAIVGDGKMNRNIVVRDVFNIAKGQLDIINREIKAKGLAELSMPKDRTVNLGIGEYIREQADKKRAEKAAEEAARAASNNSGPTSGSTAFNGGVTRNRGEMSM